MRTKHLPYTFIVLILASCTGVNYGSLQPASLTLNQYKPLESFAAPLAIANLRDYTVNYDGNAGAGSDVFLAQGYSADGGKWGDFFGTSGTTVGFQRQGVTGPCVGGGIAPECPFTWGSAGSGDYRGRDTTIFPPMSNNLHSFSKLQSISADIKLELMTGRLSVGGGFAACGLSLGFGAPGAPHVNLPSTLPISLNIANRGAKVDMIWFNLYVAPDAGSNKDSFRIEPRMNSESGGGINANAEWGASFDVMEASPLLANGDYINYRMILTFDQVNNTIDVTVAPYATNKTLSLMNSQTITWEMFKPANYVVGGEARSGIAVDHGGSGYPLTKQQVLDSKVAVGFVSNGVTKTCQLTNLVINSFD